MQYRRFGNSDLVVSEVGLGTWTLVSDWWGQSDDPQEMIRGRARRRHQLHRHRARLRQRRRGRDVPPRRPRHRATTSCSRPRSATTSPPNASSPGSRSARTTGGRSRCAQQCEDVVAAARRRPHRPLPTAQHAHRADPRRRPLGRRCSTSSTKARCASSASRSGRRSAGSRKATVRIDDRPIASLQTVFNVLEQEPGLTFAARPNACSAARSSLISRVPHASDTLSGKVTPDTVFDPKDHRSHRNRDNMLDNFEKADDAARSSGRRRPAARSARPRSRRSSPTRRSRRCCRACSPSTTCASTRRPPISRSPTPSTGRSTTCGRGTSTTTTAT